MLQADPVVLHPQRDRVIVRFQTNLDITGLGMLEGVADRLALERKILDVATLERERIAQDLHDTTAQELTGLGLLANSLRLILLAIEDITERKVGYDMMHAVEIARWQLSPFVGWGVGAVVGAIAGAVWATEERRQEKPTSR